MLNTLEFWSIQALHLLWQDLDWMLWNTGLALIPLGLSGWLFHRARSRSVLWWLGLFTFILFLPNAPYVLTDIIHIIAAIRSGVSVWLVSLVLVPAYALFMVVGVECYVVSVIRLGQYLRCWGAPWAVTGMELFTHALCAIGIYLGRFIRFDSWDVLTRPDAVLHTTLTQLTSQWPLLIMLITFGVITVTYWLCKQMTLAIAWYWPNRHRLSQL